MANRQRPILLAKIQILGARPNIGGGFLHFSAAVFAVVRSRTNGTWQKRGQEVGHDVHRRNAQCPHVRPPSVSFAHRLPPFGGNVLPFRSWFAGSVRKWTSLAKKQWSFREKQPCFAQKSTAFGARLRGTNRKDGACARKVRCKGRKSRAMSHLVGWAVRNVRVFAAKGSRSRRKISCEIRHKSVILPKGLIACLGVGCYGWKCAATPPNSVK